MKLKEFIFELKIRQQVLQLFEAYFVAKIYLSRRKKIEKYLLIRKIFKDNDKQNTNRNILRWKNIARQ